MGALQLQQPLIAAPPIELWPKVSTRVTPPEDVEAGLRVRLRVRHSDGDEYGVLADPLWAADTTSANAIVLDDYRAYVANGGLSFDPYEEERG